MRYRARLMVACDVDVIVEAGDEYDAINKAFAQGWEGEPSNLKVAKVSGLLRIRPEEEEGPTSSSAWDAPSIPLSLRRAYRDYIASGRCEEDWKKLLAGTLTDEASES